MGKHFSVWTRLFYQSYKWDSKRNVRSQNLRFMEHLWNKSIFHISAAFFIYPLEGELPLSYLVTKRLSGGSRHVPSDWGRESFPKLRPGVEEQQPAQIKLLLMIFLHWRVEAVPHSRENIQLFIRIQNTLVAISAILWFTNSKQLSESLSKRKYSKNLFQHFVILILSEWKTFNFLLLNWHFEEQIN